MMVGGLCHLGRQALRNRCFYGKEYRPYLVTVSMAHASLLVRVTSGLWVRRGGLEAI